MCAYDGHNLISYILVSTLLLWECDCFIGVPKFNMLSNIAPPHLHLGTIYADVFDIMQYLMGIDSSRIWLHKLKQIDAAALQNWLGGQFTFNIEKKQQVPIAISVAVQVFI